MNTNRPQGYYAATGGTFQPRPALSGTVRADICVVGAGFTGLSAALHLARRGCRVVVLEAEEAGFAASGRNGGQIHTGLRKEQTELESWLGRQHARDLWRLVEQSKQLLGELVHHYGVDCELKRGLVIAAHDRQALSGLAHDTEHLALHYGYGDARMLGQEETAARLGTAAYPGARLDMGGGHLHPLKLVRGLAGAAEREGAKIHETSRVVSLEPDGEIHAHCRHGEVVAGQVILACDALSGQLAPSLAPYIAHVESFLTATAPLPPDLATKILPYDDAVADTRHVLDYYRKSIDGRLLFAGREAYWALPKDIAALVRPRMLQVFPQLDAVPTGFAWSGTVGITRTRLPHLGSLSERVHFAHGYSGQGVALSILGGALLAEAALGERERFDVFAQVPARKFPGGALLRRPLVTAGLLWFKAMDLL